MKDATQFHIRPARPEEAALFYAQHPEEDKRLGIFLLIRIINSHFCIGQFYNLRE